MASRQGAVSRAETYFDSGSFKDDLARLVAFETESQNPDQKAELTRYVDEAMIPWLKEMGFTCEVFENTDSRGGLSAAIG